MNQVATSPWQTLQLPDEATPSSSSETLVTAPAVPTLIVDVCTFPSDRFIAAPGPKVVWARALVAANPQVNPASKPIRIVHETIHVNLIAAASPTTHTFCAHADRSPA